MNQPEFPTVFRGYDPVQVDQHVAALQQAADAARQEAAASSVELTKLRQSHEALRQELEGQRRSLGQLEEQARKVSSPTFADLGDRIGTMLGLADEEAALDPLRGRRRGRAGPPRRRRGRRPWCGPRPTATPRRSARGPTSTPPRPCRAPRRRPTRSSTTPPARPPPAARRPRRTTRSSAPPPPHPPPTSSAPSGSAARSRPPSSPRRWPQQDQALAAVQERADLLGREAEEDRQAAASEASRVLDAARDRGRRPGRLRQGARRPDPSRLRARARRRDGPPRQHHRPAEQRAQHARHARWRRRRRPAGRGRARRRPGRPKPARPTPRRVEATRRGADGDARTPTRRAAPRATPRRRRGPGRRRRGRGRRRAAEDDEAERGRRPPATEEPDEEVEGARPPLTGSSTSRHADRTRRASAVVGSTAGVPGPGEPAQSRGRTASQTACATSSLDAGPTWVASSEPRRSRCTVLWSWPKVLSDPDLVDDEQVAALAGQLGPGVLEHRALAVTGLGGEAHDHRRRTRSRGP